MIPNLSQKNILGLNDSTIRVDIYVLTDFPRSKRALKLLDSYPIKYNYYHINNDYNFNKISHKTSIDTFLQIFINNEFIGGYSELLDLSNKDVLLNLIH
tara:strand:- start:114 stop:410 length:297 start_codon:yes stop_codon:yes gene_type:complete